MPVRIREATERDLERLVEIHTFAFPDARGHEARMRNFRSKPLGGLPRLRVAYDPEQKNRIVGHAFLLDLAVFIGGRAVRTGGIATVGVEPACRGRGVATALLGALHEEASREAMPLTMLYAFRQGFYERAGYSAVTPFQRLSLVPASIPASFRSSLHVRHAGAGDREALCAVYERACERSTGFVARPAARWDELLSDERLAYVLALDDAGLALGAVAYRFVQTESHARVALHVEELHATDDRARLALLAHLRAQKDQVASIEISVAWDDPLVHALTDPDADRFGEAAVEHALGRVCGGPLLRVGSLHGLLAARGYDRDGELVVATTGAGHECARVSVIGGMAEVTQADPALAEVVLSSHAASVLAGGVRLGDAVRLGHARVASVDVLRRADGLLATPSFLSYDGF